MRPSIIWKSCLIVSVCCIHTSLLQGGERVTANLTVTLHAMNPGVSFGALVVKGNSLTIFYVVLLICRHVNKLMWLRVLFNPFGRFNFVLAPSNSLKLGLGIRLQHVGLYIAYRNNAARAVEICEFCSSLHGRNLQ